MHETEAWAAPRGARTVGGWQIGGPAHAPIFPALGFTPGAVWRKAIGWALALLLLAAALVADELTGNEASSSLYYLTAIAYATWILGREAGLLMAALSSLAWLTA